MCINNDCFFNYQNNLLYRIYPYTCTYLVFNRDRYLDRNYVIYPNFNFSTWFPCCVLSWLTLFSCLSFLPFVMVWVFTLAIVIPLKMHTLYMFKQPTIPAFFLIYRSIIPFPRTFKTSTEILHNGNIGIQQLMM